jgi:thiamine pyrophosphokinase
MQEGTVLSLFALRSATVSLSGTSWPLERERIEFSDRGLSNLAEGGPVLLEVHEGGPVLMILTAGDND